MHTEEEASKKFCPEARQIYRVGTIIVSGSNQRSSNTLDGTAEIMLAPCVGSACMHWRWAEIANPTYDQMEDAINAHRGGPQPTIKSTTHGYCGLSGRP
jgi:hypothetical protein